MPNNISNQTEPVKRANVSSLLGLAPFSHPLMYRSVTPKPGVLGHLTLPGYTGHWASICHTIDARAKAPPVEAIQREEPIRCLSLWIFTTI